MSHHGRGQTWMDGRSGAAGTSGKRRAAGRNRRLGRWQRRGLWGARVQADQADVQAGRRASRRPKSSQNRARAIWLIII